VAAPEGDQLAVLPRAGRPADPQPVAEALLVHPIPARGTAGVGGVPSAPANAGGLNNSGNDPSGAGNFAEVPDVPGTNAAGTANSSRSTGSTCARGSITTGTAGNRAGGTSSGRIDGTVTFGPSMPGDAEIRAEDPKVDQKIKSICKGC
jgi:hypothetical protein